VPEHLALGRAGDVVFTVQRELPGAVLEVAGGAPLDPATFGALVPQLLELIERQRDAGDLADPPWPGWLLATIDHGGEGYCLHDTMRRATDAAALLDRLQGVAARQRDAAPPRTTDVVHFDMSPANVLHVDGRLTGVVDWTVPFTGAAQGDRGFDVATLLFYGYDIDATRDDLWARALDISGLAWTAIHLAHLVLRQVEWSMRHRPGSVEEQRFVGIAHAVLDELDRRGA
jgi:Phosphotransferase enzyme family